MFRAILPAALLTLISFAGVPTHAENKKEAPKGADPAGTPLELSVTGKVTKFTTDVTTPKAADDLKNSIESASKAGRALPAAPAVDLSVEIKNTSDKPVTVWVSGDPVVLTLTLKGKGAVNAAPQLAFTQEFRVPKGVEIAAGKSHALPVKSLQSGFRGRAHWAYWTAAGEYELVATLRTAMSPPPKGAKDANDGFGAVTLTSAPLKLTIEATK